MTATPDLILWVALHTIGFIVMLWSSFIAWERRIAILMDKRPVVRSLQLGRANKQILYRIAGVLLFGVGIVVGLFPMFGLELPFNNGKWIIIGTVAVIVFMAIMDLYGEFRTP